MIFDVIFIDVVCPKPYDNTSLQLEALGGTEATVIRIAEGLAALGIRTAVFQHNRHTIVAGEYSYYIPLKDISKAKTSCVVAVRSVAHLDNFKKAKKYTWQHDLPGPHLIESMPTIMRNGVKVVGVSKWHKNAMKELITDPGRIENPKVTYVYNPVPDNLYIPNKTKVKYNPNKLVWASSPHKGLDRALFLFDRLRDITGNTDLELHVFNPGYYEQTLANHAGVIVHGPQSCTEMWQHLSEALCLFYPTNWKETFGLVAAEANAVHTPVITYELAGLREVVSDHKQKVSLNDEKTLLNRVKTWLNGERPETHGHPHFKLTEVLKDWINLFQQ